MKVAHAALIFILLAVAIQFAYQMGVDRGVERQRSYEVSASIACHSMDLDKLGVQCALVDSVAGDWSKP